MRSRPVVGLICDHRTIEDLSAQSVFDLYITAIRDGARALPLLIPALDSPLSCEDILTSVDGLLFTGYLAADPPDGALANHFALRRQQCKDAEQNQHEDHNHDHREDEQIALRSPGRLRRAECS